MAHEEKYIKLFKIFIQGLAIAANDPAISYQRRNQIIELIEQAESELKLLESDLYREQASKELVKDLGKLIEDRYSDHCIECKSVFGAHAFRAVGLNICTDCDNDLPF